MPILDKDIVEVYDSIMTEVLRGKNIRFTPDQRRRLFMGPKSSAEQAGDMEEQGQSRGFHGRYITSRDERGHNREKNPKSVQRKGDWTQIG